jgi:hypothetical protein
LSALAEVDDLLRGRGAYGESAEAEPLPWLRLAAVALAGGLFYGAVMGSYGLQPRQAFYSAVKVPLFVVVATLVCLPNFYTMNTVLGLAADFKVVIRAILIAQGTVAIGLASLAPITAFVYASITDYETAVAWNGVTFLGAALAGQVTLSRRYRALIAKNPRHRIGRAAWLTLYVFVAIQSAWVLRPFVGNPALPTRFFREGAWGNAYVEVAGLLWRLVTGAWSPTP